jgi:hypothetical protein
MTGDDQGGSELCDYGRHSHEAEPGVPTHAGTKRGHKDCPEYCDHVYHHHHHQTRSRKSAVVGERTNQQQGQKKTAPEDEA